MADQSRQEFGRAVGLDDQSKTNAITTAIGASALFGPIGLLLGAGVGLLSKRLHESELDRAIAGYQADQDSSNKLRELFAADMAFDAQLYEDPRVTDIDRRQHQMIASRAERAQVLMQHPDPAVRDRGMQLMEEAGRQREAWLEDIEGRTETLADVERDRAWKLEDDVAQMERDLFKQSLQFQQQEKMQAEQERIATERALLMDNITTLKDAYRGKSAAIRDTDHILATIEQESFVHPETGERVLTQAGRAALEAAVELRVRSGPIAQTLMDAGKAGRGSEIAALVQFGAQVAKTFTSYITGENVSDAELLELLQALDRAGETHFDNIIESAQPAVREQAARAGANPDSATAGVTFELTDRQKGWRSQYGQKWDTDRNRTVRGRPGEPLSDEEAAEKERRRLEREARAAKRTAPEVPSPNTLFNRRPTN